MRQCAREKTQQCIENSCHYGCGRDKQRKLGFLQGDGNLARPYIPTLDARFTLCLGRWLVCHGLEQGLLAPRPPLKVWCLGQSPVDSAPLVYAPTSAPLTIGQTSPRRGQPMPARVLASVEKCEAVCGLVSCRRMRGTWDAWCCYNYPFFKGIVRDPKLSSNSLPLGGPSSSLKTQREKRVTAFAACPEKSLSCTAVLRSVSRSPCSSLAFFPVRVFEPTD